MRAWPSLFAAAALSGCGAPAARPPTWFRDVEPIVQARCQGCHAQGGIAPFTLVNFEDLRARAAAISAAVSSRQMPPWPPSRLSAPLLHDRSLSEEQIRTVTDWV